MWMFILGMFVGANAGYMLFALLTVNSRKGCDHWPACMPP
jgi:hypothetical protein